MVEVRLRQTDFSVGEYDSGCISCGWTSSLLLRSRDFLRRGTLPPFFPLGWFSRGKRTVKQNKTKQTVSDYTERLWSLSLYESFYFLLFLYLQRKVIECPVTPSVCLFVRLPFFCPSWFPISFRWKIYDALVFLPLSCVVVNLCTHRRCTTRDTTHGTPTETIIKFILLY